MGIIDRMSKPFWISIGIRLGLGIVLLSSPALIHGRFLWASVAQAAKTQTKKKAKRKVTPHRPDTYRHAQGQERKTPAGFEWAARTTDVDMDIRADQKRDEVIAKLEILLPTISDGPQKAELVFRLSETYWSKFKYKKLRAMRLWDEQLEDWHTRGSRGSQPKLEDIDEAGEADVYKRKALDLYARILKNYPQYPRKDEVLYNLGSSHYEAGDEDEGIAMYRSLIKQFPHSEYVPDAHLQLGEHFFRTNQLTHAIAAYTHAAGSKKPRIYSFALYKLAWCDFNLQEYERALEKFQGVIDYARKHEARQYGGIAERDRIQLLEEALSDMLRAYSHLDAVGDAFDFYQREVGHRRAYTYLRKLAGHYHGEGKFAQEIRTYQRLNSEYPSAPEAPLNQVAIMNAFSGAGRPHDVRRAVRKLIDLYSPNSLWAQRNSGNGSVLTKAFAVVEEELANLVTQQHREAQQTKLVETYKLARDIYKEYLDKFTESKNTYEFTFFYAEILYELKDFRSAAEQYDHVVRSAPRGTFAKHSAYSAVLAWEKVTAGVEETLGKKIINVKRGKQKGALRALEGTNKLEKKQANGYQEVPLSEPEQKLIAACDVFATIAPKDDEVIKVKFKSARLYYNHNHFTEAAARFHEIIERWPKSDLARMGAESVLRSFNVRGDWAQLNTWARRFRDNRHLMADKRFARQVEWFVEGAAFNEIRFVFEPKDPKEQVAQRYSSFVEEFPESKYAMVSLYNAIINYDKANRLEMAMEEAKRLFRSYETFQINREYGEQDRGVGTQIPDPAGIREEVLFLQASFHERLAELEDAADLYEHYAKEFPKGSRRADALFNAGLFREGLGEYDKAISNFQLYLRDYPRQKDWARIAWRVGLILEKKKDHGGVQRYFQNWSRVAKSHDEAQLLCAELEAAKAIQAQGKDSEAKSAYRGLLNTYGRLSKRDKQEDCPLEAAAKGSFELLEEQFEDYKAIPLSGVSQKIMAQNLTKKIRFVAALEKKYADVLGFGHGDYGIAALYRIGQVYEHLAETILGTQCPRQLNEDQCMIYLAALQEKAFPLEEKAIEAFDKAIAKAYQLGLYNDWLLAAQGAMHRYEPQRFPEQRTFDLLASDAMHTVPDLREVTP